MSIIYIDNIPVVKGNFGECWFCDNMHPKYGMPSLSPKVFDEIITDPPYNINAKITKGEHFSKRQNQQNPRQYIKRRIIQPYNDYIVDYPTFSHTWFTEAQRVANYIMFTCGRMNKRMWYQMADFHEIIWFIPNSPSRGYVSTFLYYEPILCYGEYSSHRIKKDVIQVFSTLGFLLRNKTENIITNHPHPKPLKLYEILLKESHPKSLLDCFAGSCRTGLLAERWGIPWKAYEINSTYIPLVQHNIQKGMKDHDQTTLNFLLKK